VIWLGSSISLILLTATVLIHYELLLGISEITPKSRFLYARGCLSSLLPFSWLTS
jgi:hypothetical protein